MDPTNKPALKKNETTSLWDTSEGQVENLGKERSDIKNYLTNF